jgi:Uma2 family endonuclease
MEHPPRLVAVELDAADEPRAMDHHIRPRRLIHPPRGRRIPQVKLAGADDRQIRRRHTPRKQRPHHGTAEKPCTARDGDAGGRPVRDGDSVIRLRHYLYCIEVNAMVARRWITSNWEQSLEGTRMTADEFLAVGETERKCELVHGVVMMSPSPNFSHQRTLAALVGQMQPFIAAHELGEVVTDYDVRISDAVVYEPDLLFVSAAKLRSLAGALNFAPDIVVEILSPSTHRKDLETKLLDYQRFGISEYWIFNPDAAEAMFLRLHGGAYVEITSVEQGLRADSYRTGLLPGFALDLGKLRKAMSR